MLKKYFIIIISSLFMLFSSLILANSLSLYENPDTKAKIIATVKNDETLLAVFYSQKNEWIKVANPKTGDVGWAKYSDIKNPLIITKATDSSFAQQIIVGGKDKQPCSYQMFQYRGLKPMKPEDAHAKMHKIMLQMQKDQEEMQAAMQQMHKRMSKMMSDMMK